MKIEITIDPTPDRDLVTHVLGLLAKRLEVVSMMREDITEPPASEEYILYDQEHNKVGLAKVYN